MVEIIQENINGSKVESYSYYYQHRWTFILILTNMLGCFYIITIADMSEEKKDMTTISTAVENQDTTSENKDTSS